jgi:hypothetical protein
MGANLRRTARVGYGVFLLTWEGFGPPLSPWLAAMVLAGTGAGYLWMAATNDANNNGSAGRLATAGGLAVFAGYLHALLATPPLLLPIGPRELAWAVGVAPCLCLLFAFGERQPATLGRPLHRLSLGLGLTCFGVFLAVLFDVPDVAGQQIGRWLTFTTLVYAALAFIATFRTRTVRWLYAGTLVATLGALARLGGYPSAWILSAAQTGFWLTVIGAGWLGTAATLALAARRGDTRFAEAMTSVALLVTTIGTVLAFAGVAGANQGRWTVYALALAGSIYGVIGLLRREASFAHAAFAAYFVGLRPVSLQRRRPVRRHGRTFISSPSACI